MPLSSREPARSAHEPGLPAHRSNRILASLPPADYQRLRMHLKLVPVRHKQVLIKQDDLIETVIFPVAGVLSLIRGTEEGKTVELAMVGDEGAVGAAVFFGQPDSAYDVVVQVRADPPLGLPAEVFRSEMAQSGALFNRVIRYTQALMSDVIQTATCNGLHSTYQRCCRWLLTLDDRVGHREFPLTHELFATMLGVRRPTITLIARDLQKAGIATYRRGFITIRSREALESAACECYQASTRTYARLLPDLYQSSAR